MSKLRKARIATASIVTLVVISGLVGEIRYGTVCSPDVWQFAVTDPFGFLLRSLGLWRVSITATCPLGFLERSLAARELLPQWFSVGLIVFSVILLGRVFCAWICPTVFLRRVFGDKRGSQANLEAAPKGKKWASYSSYAFLGGVLAASFLFRFPVFCFFCPIGLFFGSVYAAIRFFSPDTPGLELVIFPVLLGVELWGFKSWCRSICPLGALLSLVGNLNRVLVPTVKKDECHTSKGINCQACKRACPEGIDLVNIKSKFSPNSCTKCLECYTKCPMKAIKFPLWA